MKTIMFYLLFFAMLLPAGNMLAQELVLNGSFNDTTAHWSTQCTNVEANYFETTYGGSNTTNRVAEIDDLTCTYQDICILSGTSYRLSLRASRRTSAGALISTNIKAEALDAAGTIVGIPLIDFTFSRDNTPFNFTPVTGIPLIAVPQGSGIVRLRLRFTDVTPGFDAQGMIIDEVSLVFEPQPAYAGDTVTCMNSLTSHTITNLPAGALYQWNFDGGMPDTATQVSPVTAWPSNGIKTVSCIISNPVCPVDTFLQLVTVGNVASPGVVSPVNYCSGDTATVLSATGVNLLWYTAVTGGVGSTTPPMPATTVTGTTTWYVSQLDGDCESPRVPIAVIVHQAVTADFSYTTQYGCTADSIVFVNLSAGNGNYTWHFGDNAIAMTSQPGHTYPHQGIYEVKLVSAAGYCSDSISKIIDLRHPLVAAFNTDDSIVCFGNSIHFADTSVATTRNGIAPAYFWDFGDGHTAAIRYPEHTYALPGVYRVRLQVTDFVPCHDTAFAWVYVDSASSLQLTTGDTALCLGETFSVNALLPQMGLVSFTCDFGDNTTAFEGNPAQHAYDLPGIFPVTASAVYRACPDTAVTVLVKVQPLPVLNLGPDTALCLNGPPVYLSDQVNGDNLGATWRWSNGDTTAGTKIVAPGNYKATVTIAGCSTSDEVVVHKDCYVDIPNVFSPNGDGVNDYFFPRQLLSRGVNRFNMKVHNRWGQLIFVTDQKEGRGWDGRFNDIMQSQGVYLYNIDIVLKNGTAEHYSGNVTLLP